MIKSITIIIFSSLISCISTYTTASELPDGFVYVKELIPDVIEEIRYHGEDNFIGLPIKGYLKPKAIITREAALTLKNIQAELRTFGLGLKIFDAYRPQQSVDHFVRWAKDLDDIKMKSIYYPDVNKQYLFRDGYIASHSSHTRGSTVDLTIVSLLSIAREELDMGSSWDYFGPISWPSSIEPNATQRSNRMLLQQLMIRHGFRSLSTEWWHFTFINEPFPDTYFNFPIQ